MPVDAVLLAAGNSTRIAAVGGGIPKPLLAVQGEPILVRNVRWLAGARLASATRTRLPLGTTFRFNLNRAARVRFDFTQQRAGRRVARRCVAQTARNVRRPRCRRTVTVGTLSLAAHAGANRIGGHNHAADGFASRRDRLHEQQRHAAERFVLIVENDVTNDFA